MSSAGAFLPQPADTGGTIVKASELLLANGASTVVVAATHAVFSPPAVER